MLSATQSATDQLQRERTKQGLEAIYTVCVQLKKRKGDLGV